MALLFEGGFRPGPKGTIWKRLCPTELKCLMDFEGDELQEYAPKYFGQSEIEGDGI